MKEFIKLTYGHACGTFDSYLMEEGLVPLWADNPVLYSKGTWMVAGKQVTKQHSLVVSASAPASRFLP